MVNLVKNGLDRDGTQKFLGPMMLGMCFTIPSPSTRDGGSGQWSQQQRQQLLQAGSG